ncbi:HNH endonuclease [Candidatus Avelusimicrobium faecicola]|uniref:HNH endonuclease n=1 Tax=Candidatus Avelusimicrobium faecicola TaxID=3416205 RepID=UPI00206B94FB|nr:MAG TPA: HNH endonuclease [Caudoviricetes sp.]
MCKCFYCGKSFTPKKPEHIIPNCIGGKLKDKTILCAACNQQLSSIDKAFDSFRFVNILENPARDNGAVAQVAGDVEGVRVSIGPGLKDMHGLKVVSFDKSKKTAKIAMLHTPGIGETKNKECLFSLLEKMGTGKNLPEQTKKEHFQKIWDRFSAKGERIEAPLVRSAGACSFGENLLLAVLKIALGMYCHWKLDRSFISRAVQILQKREDIAKIVTWLALHPVPGVGTAHVVLLEGNPKTRQLYAIISIYNAFPFFVLLNTAYDGPQVHKVYCYQLKEHSEILLDIAFPVSPEQTQKILSTSKEDVGRIIKNSLDMVIKKHLRQSEDLREKLPEQTNWILSEAQKTVSHLAWIREFFSTEQYNEYFIQNLVISMGKNPVLTDLGDDFKRDLAGGVLKFFPYSIYKPRYYEGQIVQMLLDEIAPRLCTTDAEVIKKWESIVEDEVANMANQVFEDRELTLFLKQEFMPNRQVYVEMLKSSCSHVLHLNRKDLR